MSSHLIHVLLPVRWFTITTLLVEIVIMLVFLMASLLVPLDIYPTKLKLWVYWVVVDLVLWASPWAYLLGGHMCWEISVTL